jgi:hypothetical protein
MRQKSILSILIVSVALAAAVFGFEAQTLNLESFESDFLPAKDLSGYNGEEIFSMEAWPDEELIENHLDHGLDLEMTNSEHPIVGKTRLGVDRLCTNTNTQNNVCTVTDKSLRFTSDLLYETELSLVFNASRIKCLTVNYQPCTLHLKVVGSGKVILDQGTSIVGKQVIIEAPDAEVHILEGSSLWASGQSMMNNGTMFNGVGANFIGQGGYCGDELMRKDFKTYGNFSMMPAMDEEGRISDLYGDALGSIGHEEDVETAGGGRIVVMADSVKLVGEGEKI